MKSALKEREREEEEKALLRVSMDTALPADHISPASDIHPLHLRFSFVRGRAQRVLLLLATSRRLHLLQAFPAHLDDRVMPNHVHVRYSLYLYTVPV